MKDIKRKYVNYMPFDYEGIEDLLEREARAGWHLEQSGAVFWTFRKGEPVESTYSVVYRPKVSAYDPEDADSVAEFDNFCEEAGWKYVSGRGKVRIYRSDEPDPVPIDTDEELKLKSMRKSILGSYIVPMLLIVVLLNAGGSGLLSILKRPASVLSNYNGMLSMAVTGTLTLMVLLSFIVFGLWLKKSTVSVRDGGSCASTSVFRTGYKIFEVLILLFAALWCLAFAYEEGAIFGIIGAALILLLIFFVMGVGQMTDRFRAAGLSKAANMVITIAVVVVVVGALTQLVTWSFYTLEDGKWGRDGSQMIMKVSDFREDAGRQYKYSHRETATFLMSLKEAEQEETGVSDPDAWLYDLSYEILKVPSGNLYDRCLDQWIKEGIGFEWLDGNEKDTGYREKDAANLHADRAYSYYWNDEEDGTWILCYPGAIVRVETTFEPASGDLEKIDEKVAAAL